MLPSPTWQSKRIDRPFHPRKVRKGTAVPYRFSTTEQLTMAADLIEQLREIEADRPGIVTNADVILGIIQNEYGVTVRDIPGFDAWLINGDES